MATHVTFLATKIKQSPVKQIDNDRSKDLFLPNGYVKKVKTALLLTEARNVINRT